MITANISNARRKAIYRRDGYRCALCDSTRYLQIHHYVPRGHGGSDFPENLVTLCSTCHGHVHGVVPDGSTFTPEDIDQAICEYLSDYYAGDWYPYK